MDVSHVRRAGLAAAVAAGSVAAAVGAVALLFREEGRAAQQHVGHRLGDRGPDADGVYSPDRGGPGRGGPVRLAIAGDSVADSLGASNPEATLGALLATALAEHAGRAVELRTIATVGAKTEALDTQIGSLQGFLPDVTVIIVGGNDLTSHVPLADSARQLQGAVAALRALGGEVVVGTCPDFDTLPSLPQPLREFGGQMSRRLAAAQFRAAGEAGAHPVLLGRSLRQIFLSDPGDMFAIDGFHPSNLGYRSASLVLIPALQEAYDDGRRTLGAGPTEVPPLRPGTQ